jgi:threonine/homoserine/homoserine lactone efflux protein
MAMSLAVFAWTALLIELTPGPNMTYLALLSARRGIKVASAAVAGVAVGLTVIGLAAALGFGEVVARTRWLYELIRWGGVAFLLYLAFDAWRGDERAAQLPLEEATRSAFRDGFVTNLLNPKAAAFFLSVLPAFTDPTRAYAGQAVPLVLIYVAIATAVHVVIVVAAGQAAALLVKDELRRNAGRAMSLALVVVAGWLAVATR